MKSLALAALLLAACTSAPSGSAGGAASAAPTVAATAAASAAVSTPSSQATTNVVVASDCKAPATVTTESTEGPYFKAGSPEKASLVTSGMSGTRILLAGLVLTRSCKPVVDTKVDIWQADASGNYDNSGYTLRGYVKTSAEGVYRIETIVPGLYPGRTPHIHVKVTPPGGRTLTTQLYMPNVSSNSSDGIFRQELVMQITQGPPMTGAFVFIVDLP